MDIILGWSIFFGLGFLYLLYRVGKNKLIVIERKNRVQIYALFCLMLASLFGQLGFIYRDNFIFYFASLATELSFYFFAAAAKLPKRPSGRLITRPVLWLLLIATNIIEVVCFQFAGQDFWRYSMAIHTELPKSGWLLAGALTTLVYVTGINFYLTLEIFWDSKADLDFSQQYNSYTSALNFGMSTCYFVTDFLRYVLFTLIGDFQILEVGLWIRGQVAIPCYILVFIRLFADKWMYKSTKKIYDRDNLRLLMGLEEFYNKANSLFPIEYSFNVYELVRNQIKTSSWVLNEVIDNFADLRHYFWQVEALRVGEQNLPTYTTLERECAVWEKCLSNPETTNNLLKSCKVSVQPPRFKSTNNTNKAIFYTKLAKRIDVDRKVAEYAA